MAMTNEQIIFNAAVSLLQEGKIKGTGRVLRVETESGIMEIPEPEQIHTFQAWKEGGYKVRKGEHAVARIGIWKYVSHKPDPEKPDDDPGGHCIMKTACFFAASQVEPA